MTQRTLCLVLTVWRDLTPVKTTLAAAAQGSVGVVSTSQLSTGVSFETCQVVYSQGNSKILIYIAQGGLVEWFTVSVIKKL